MSGMSPRMWMSDCSKDIKRTSHFVLKTRQRNVFDVSHNNEHTLTESLARTVSPSRVADCTRGEHDAGNVDSEAWRKGVAQLHNESISVTNHLGDHDAHLWRVYYLT